MMDEEKIEEAKERLKIDIADEKMLGTDVAIAYKNDIETILQYIDELEKDLKFEKEWRIRLDKENQGICNIVNNDFIRKSKVRELIDRYNDLDYISAYETIIEIEKLVN